MRFMKLFLCFFTLTIILSIPAANAALTAESIYQQHCSTCHSMGLAGAPRKGNEKDWKPHLAKGNDVMLKNAIKGFNAMPVRGTCGECSDQELRSAIDYMLPQHNSSSMKKSK